MNAETQMTTAVAFILALTKKLACAIKYSYNFLMHVRGLFTFHNI